MKRILNLKNKSIFVLLGVQHIYELIDAGL
jgi:hypothetical protein